MAKLSLLILDLKGFNQSVGWTAFPCRNSRFSSKLKKLLA